MMLHFVLLYYISLNSIIAQYIGLYYVITYCIKFMLLPYIILNYDILFFYNIYHICIPKNTLQISHTIPNQRK